MTELTKELIEKAKLAQTAEELVTLAKAENMDLSLEQATEYMETLHPPMGELKDDDLDNVAGGACHTKDGRRVVTVTQACKHWKCKKCGTYISHSNPSFRCTGANCSHPLIQCKSCAYMSYEKALWLCNHPAKRK